MMKAEYDIEKLNPRKNPYSNRLKKQVTINIDSDTIDFFKSQSEELANKYAEDCLISPEEIRKLLYEKTI